jgi:uncharacterized membrane protein YgdD (TMEM256/DUF423 family)
MPPFWTIGTLFGASSVALGAFGAHGLKKRIADPARIGNWGTAAQYQVCFFFFSLSMIALMLRCVTLCPGWLLFCFVYFLITRPNLSTY